MSTAAQILAGVAAALHVLFFYLESIAFTTNGTYKTFGLATREEAEIVKPMALNQGFYNLFLALGVAVGLILWNAGLGDGQLDGLDAWALRGQGAVTLSLACMLGAAIVLLISSKGRLLRGTLIQGTAPLLALLLLAAS